MPKIPTDKLSTQLDKRLAPIYLVSGDEALIVQESCDMIRSKARTSGYVERELFTVESQFNWDSFLLSSNSLSLFSEKKLLELRIPNGKPGDAGSKALIEYCKTPSSDNVLLVVLPKLDKRAQQAKWFKTVSDSADSVFVWPINSQQFPQWIENRLAKHGLRANTQAIDILCAKTEGNLLAAAQEIEKLKLLDTETVIDANTMAKMIMSSARYDIFGLVDKALMGQAEQAVSSLNGLRAEGTEATIILWALSKEIRTLTQLREALDAGKSFDFAAKQQGVWENRKAMIRRSCQRLDIRQLHLLLRKSGQIDKTIKGLEKGNSWNLLLDLVLMLAGINTFSRRTQIQALNLSNTRSI